MARRTDGNQAEIVQALRAFGCSVQDLSQLGKGTPDLLCGWKGRNFVLEVKNCEDRAPRLTHCEEEWIRRWAGQVAVITSVEDAKAVIQDEDYEDAAVQDDLSTKGGMPSETLGRDLSKRAGPSSLKNLPFRKILE